MKKLFKLFLAVCLIVGFYGSAFAQDEVEGDEIGVTDEVIVDDGSDYGVEEPLESVEGSVEAPPMEYQMGDAVEFTGVVEVTPADEANGEKYATIILKVGEESYKLLPSEAKDAFNGLEGAAGKSINVKGTYLPADETHPLAAVKVTEWSE